MDRPPLLVGGIEACESPIESRLADQLLLVAPRIGDLTWLTIHPQYEIETVNGTYRTDFYIGALIRAYLSTLLVECDGHDFHEKTKEQAAYDKQRDRALQRRGFAMIHFTGSEVWRDPEGCAYEVFGTLSAQVPTGERVA